MSCYERVKERVLDFGCFCITDEVGIKETKKTLVGLRELAEPYAYGLWA